MAVSSATRGIFAIIFIVFSAIGLYLFRILPIQRNLPTGFDRVLANKHLDIPFQYVKIPERYTGFKVFDDFFRVYISAFSYGVLRLDKDAFWQHLHFLLGFFPIITVWTIEAFRPRNQGALFTYTSVWAALYQTIGGAFIVPLHGLSYMFRSRDTEYLRFGRPMQLNTAKALIPSLVLGYVVPTLLTYYPRESQQTSLYLCALWQFSPILVNVLMGNLSGIINMFQSNKNISRTADFSWIKWAYVTSMLVSFISHAFVIIAIFAADWNEISMTSVFIPGLDRLGKSASQDVHFMFQVDWIICGASALVFAWYAIREVANEQAALGIESDAITTAFMLPVHALLLGSGGALAATWWWRENALAEIEERAAARKAK